MPAKSSCLDNNGAARRLRILLVLSLALVPLVAGAHRLVVVDDAGRSHAVDYRVE